MAELTRLTMHRTVAGEYEAHAVWEVDGDELSETQLLWPKGDPAEALSDWFAEVQGGGEAVVRVHQAPGINADSWIHTHDEGGTFKAFYGYLSHQTNFIRIASERALTAEDVYWLRLLFNNAEGHVAREVTR